MTFSFRSADIFRGADLILSDFNWEWKTGEHWLLTGPVGSGKTTIAQAVFGKVRTSAGSLIFFENERQISIYEAKPRMQYLAFTEDTHKLRFGDVFYYQQRYQAMESDAGLTVAAYLFGKGRTDLPADLEALNLEPLFDRRFIQLSNGQTRRVRLAKSLMARPSLLILEEVFTGMDKFTTGIIEKMLEQKAAEGTSILLIGDHAPSFITHVQQLKAGGEAVSCRKEDWQGDMRKKRRDTSLPDGLPATFFQQPDRNEDWNFENALVFDDVVISYQNKKVVSGLSWQVKKGDKWMVSGPNGSGKSSVISLIFADNPQAYAQRIVLFDRVRGSGESIWDIKRKIGFISPELQTYMRSRRPAVDVAAAGYTNTMVLSRKLTSGELDRLRRLFDLFSVRHLARKPFMDLSSGEQRMILFIRAVVNNAPMLILDEPFHAMDDHFKEKCLDFLGHYCHADRSLIYVSHLQEPPPSFITRELTLSLDPDKKPTQRAIF